MLHLLQGDIHLDAARRRAMADAADLDESESAVALVCPDCKVRLRASGESLRCPRCDQSFAIRNGVATFCEAEDFYNDYLEEHCPYVRHPQPWKRALLRVLPYWSWREWKFFRSHLPPGLKILDLGCARGKEWFADGASFIAGADPSPASLTECALHYDLAVQAEITRLPFESDTFDCVVTSHVLGHIPATDKDAALNEIWRVLKPGGLSINIIETDSHHRFVGVGKSDSELYRLNFIETDGHVGLELPTQVLARFGRHGFAVRDVRKMESGLVHLRYYEKYLGKGYPARHSDIRRRIAIWRTIQRSPLILGLYEILMGFYHHLVEPWHTRLDDAMFIGLSAMKSDPRSA